eukprot:2502624-Pyramimonas_sp.AAC.1
MCAIYTTGGPPPAGTGAVWRRSSRTAGRRCRTGPRRGSAHTASTSAAARPSAWGTCAPTRSAAEPGQASCQEAANRVVRYTLDVERTTSTRPYH